ncbi:hypothetical protein Q7P37_004824 [Cladosporium fusiforme]
MGLLERARSQRVRHTRKRSSRSVKSEDLGQAALKGSPPRTKRKSIFPGLSSSNTPSTTTSEASRPRSKSAHEAFYQAQPEGATTPQAELTALPNAMRFPPRNDSFRFPSPALLNNNGKNTPPTSIAHLPSLTVDQKPPPVPEDFEQILATPRNNFPKPLPPPYGRSATEPVITTTSHQPLPAQAYTWSNQSEEAQRPQIRKQRSAWKTFGDFFKGKQSKQPTPEPFYNIQPPSNDALTATPKRTLGKVGVLDSPLPSPVHGTGKRVDSGRSLQDSSPPQTKRANRGKSQNFSRPNLNIDNCTLDEPNSTPKLDTVIPDGGFPRYSVMFEKLLEPKPKPSLLERRLSKRTQMERINAQDSNNAVTGETTSLQRSVTSPHLTRMPSLTIHVANSNHATKSKATHHSSRRPAAPKRSNTTPTTAHLALPAFNARTPVTAKAIPLPKQSTNSSSTTSANPTTVISSPDSINSMLSENSLPPTPTTATSIASSIDTTVFGPSSTSKATTTPSPPPPIPSRSAERPHLMRNPPTGTEPFNRQIVQVSVARQVSVSKARRRVADASEVKQPLRPRVVELGKNRKSTLVMIEGGD